MKVGALSCVNTEDLLAKSDFATSSVGKSLDLNSLSNIRKNNINHPIPAHIDISSIRNKFDQLVDDVKGKVDVFMISETKIDDSFPTMEFHIEGYCVFRSERSEYGGGILVYVREDIPFKLISMKKMLNRIIFHRAKFKKKEMAVKNTNMDIWVVTQRT